MLEENRTTTPAALCPCCGYRTLIARAVYDICPVCFWEDDGWGDAGADEPDGFIGGPNHGLTLTQARINFRELGAVEARLVQYTRPPNPGEMALDASPRHGPPLP